MNVPQKISRPFKKLGIALIALVIVALFPTISQANEFVIYGVHRALDLGNPGESPQKDFYVNLGSDQGVRIGASLEVLRRTSTYDLNTQKLYKDMLYPIGKLKVIHVESNAAIARLEQFLPADKTPILAPKAFMIGDLVQLSQGH
jgi:hypothetical protein